MTSRWKGDQRDFNVRNVARFMRGYEEQHLHTIQQILEWFGVCRKMERIIWAMLKKNQLERMRVAEDRAKGVYQDHPTPASTVEKEVVGKDGKKRVVRKRVPAELPDMRTVVGFCPKCGSHIYGEPQQSCKKRVSEPVFYKECKACPWWAEVWRKRNKYIEIEGG